MQTGDESLSKLGKWNFAIEMEMLQSYKMQCFGFRKSTRYCSLYTQQAVHLLVTKSRNNNN